MSQYARMFDDLASAADEANETTIHPVFTFEEPDVPTKNVSEHFKWWSDVLKESESKPIVDPTCVKMVHMKLDADVLTEGLENPQNSIRMADQYYGGMEHMVRSMLLDHWSAMTDIEGSIFSASKVDPAVGDMGVVTETQFNNTLMESLAVGVFETIENIFETDSEEEFNAEAYSKAVHEDGDKLFETIAVIKNNITNRVDLRKQFYDEFGLTNDFDSVDIDVRYSNDPIDNHVIIEYSVYKSNEDSTVSGSD